MKKELIGFLICILLIFSAVLPTTGIAINKKTTLEDNLAFNDQIMVDEISFYWGISSNAIPIKTSKTGLLIATPEYYPIINRNNPAAYVRGEYIVIKAKFKSQEFSKVNVKATGSFGGFQEKEVSFQFGISSWIKFTTIDPISEDIKSYNVNWTWMYQNPISSEWEEFDVTTHTIYALNKKPITRTVWKELVEWTTDWCKGLPDDDKQIADAIINGFVEDDVLRYAVINGFMQGFTTQQLLKYGRGVCEGMMHVFFDACATQGVKTVGLIYQTAHWHEVTLKPGLGNIEPDKSMAQEQTWKLVNEVYPYPCYYGSDNPEDDVDEEYFSAYEFVIHCVNLLEYNGEVYLYDLSFGMSPSESVFVDIPENGAYPSEQFPDFRQNYFNVLYDYMYGHIYYRDEEGDLIFDDVLEFCVNTSIIPDVVENESQITYIFEIDHNLASYQSYSQNSQIIQQSNPQSQPQVNPSSQNQQNSQPSGQQINQLLQNLILRHLTTK